MESKVDALLDTHFIDLVTDIHQLSIKRLVLCHYLLDLADPSSFPLLVGCYLLS